MEDVLGGGVIADATLDIGQHLTSEVDPGFGVDNGHQRHPQPPPTVASALQHCALSLASQQEAASDSGQHRGARRYAVEPVQIGWQHVRS
ncbi:MAG: hypothetical protein IPF40_08210 [Actinomycetales bacterium]|uniref:Uncharacterized protein n=1 Tax=Candidatus Phosphoribacter hodrii TaxID=2953743 RepID=A0A935CDR7_9MICO|nr:hypothetical protein [Candidatus Phosphoribacter hodrii]